MAASGILVAAGGQPWESRALQVMDEAGLPVLKRCVDLTDLLASAATGQAGIALVSEHLMGLDSDAVLRLLRHDVRPVAVGETSLARIGIPTMVSASAIEQLPAAIGAATVEVLVPDPAPEAGEVLPSRTTQGVVVAVHGPTGAPGRTLVATTLAALRAQTAPTVLVDADPQSGSVAQQFGVLDEVSGLLAAARLANTGGLDAASFARCRRKVGDRLDVVTGLPRADRWSEIRTGALEAILAESRQIGDVVVDVGFSLEDDTDMSRSVGRNLATLETLAAADHLVVVGSAEPVGLARLARSLAEVTHHSSAPIRVVVNRMRDSLGWSKRDVISVIESYATPVAINFVGLDQPSVDRALVAGRALPEMGESAIVRDLQPVCHALFGGAHPRSDVDHELKSKNSPNVV